MLKIRKSVIVNIAMPGIHASSGEDVLALDSDLAELERLQAFIDAFCEREGVPEEAHYHLNVALEELVINAMKHGGCDPKKGAIRLAMRVEDEAVRITLSDTGVSFNPLMAATPELNDNIRQRPIGGLGIHLVRCLVPAIRYERHDGRNYLYLTKPVKRDGGDVRREEDTHANCNGDHPR